MTLKHKDKLQTYLSTLTEINKLCNDIVPELKRNMLYLQDCDMPFKNDNLEMENAASIITLNNIILNSTKMEEHIKIIAGILYKKVSSDEQDDVEDTEDAEESPEEKIEDVESKD